jgi:hypothetical protein
MNADSPSRIIAFMQIPFQITALPIEKFRSLLNQSVTELQTIGARRMFEDGKISSLGVVFVPRPIHL